MTLDPTYWTLLELPEDCVEGIWRNCCVEGKYTLCLDTESALFANGIRIEKKGKPCCKGNHTTSGPRIVIEGFSADDIVKILNAMKSE